MGRQDQIRGGLHQRVTWVNQVGHRLAMQTHLLLLEANAFVLFKHRGAGFADDAITFAQGRRNMADFVPSWLAGTQLSTQAGEGFSKKHG